MYVNDDPGVASVEFTTVPNLNRMLQERRNAIPASEVNERVKQAVSDCFTMPRQQSQRHLRATVFPSGSDIPDNPDSVALGVINYDWLHQEHDGLRSAIANLYRNSPAGGGQSPRQYKNNLVLLVADNKSSGDLEHHARRALAARQIQSNPPETLQPYQRDSLDGELASAEKDLFVAIQRLYVNLYYPSTDHPISSDTLMHHVVISPEVAVERPGDGQHAIIGTLASRRKVMTLETADLDPETYWKRRRNLAEGKVCLSNLKEEFAREPGNYMVLNGAVADALLKNALDRQAIVIQTGAGQMITRGNDLLRTDGSEDYVYLRDKSCPECLRFLDDCPGHEGPQPQEYPPCGKEQHEGECQASPAPAPEPPGQIPSFNSGLQPQPLNVLGAELRRHMDLHGATSAEIETLTMGGDKADFIGYVVGLLGQSVKASVSYDLRRGGDFNVTVNGMGASEWSTVMNRIAPALERMEGSSVMSASVTVHGDGSSAEQIDRILDRLPAGHEAGMEASFKRQSDG